MVLVVAQCPGGDVPSCVGQLDRAKQLRGTAHYSLIHLVDPAVEEHWKWLAKNHTCAEPVARGAYKQKAL